MHMQLPSEAPAGAPAQKMLRVDGLDIEILESGGAGSPVFFCHGNSSSAAAFAPLFDTELGRRHRLIAMSFPGHGASQRARDPGQYAIPRLGQLAARVLGRLGLRSYVLVGHSLGGHALLEAAPCFDGARGLMLVSAPPLSPATLGAAFQPDPSGGALFAGALDAARAAELARCFVADPASAALPALTDAILRTDPRFRPALLHSLQQGEMRDEWRAIEDSAWPLALLRGAHDRFLHAAYFERVPPARLWGGAALDFPACGHALHVEAPRQFGLALARFVAAVDEAP